MTGHGQCARRRPEPPGQCEQQAGPAGARRPDDGRHRRGSQGQVNVLEHPSGLAEQAQSRCLQHRSGRLRRALRRRARNGDAVATRRGWPVPARVWVCAGACWPGRVRIGCVRCRPRGSRPPGRSRSPDRTRPAAQAGRRARPARIRTGPGRPGRTSAGRTRGVHPDRRRRRKWRIHRCPGLAAGGRTDRCWPVSTADQAAVSCS